MISILLGVFAVFVSIIVYRVYLHPLSHVPGPFIAKFTHGWQNYKYIKGAWFQTILDVHEKYGPVVRISPDEISFVDGDAWKRLYGHVKPCVKSKWYETWYIPPAGHGIFSERSIEARGARRRLVATAYAMSSVLGYEDKIQRILDENWNQFRKLAATGEKIDMDHWATYFAYDIVSELALGNTLGMVKTGHDVNRVMESSTRDVLYAVEYGPCSPTKFLGHESSLPVPHQYFRNRIHERRQHIPKVVNGFSRREIFL
jgi:cytochrome P450